MAEGQELRKCGDESVKLFVGQVPKHMTESQLLAMFKEFALVDGVNIIKDKATRASRGCCFVVCPSREEADKAVNACHNKRTLPGASSPLQVRYADGELERLENKLFVGMLPKNVSEDELSDIFCKYGTIKEIQILRGSPQTSKACAFLKYETQDQAQAALEGVNGKCSIEGSSVPLVVKWADTEKERQARRAQKYQLQASHISSISVMHSSLYGTLPMSYVRPYNGYGYQYRLQPIQSQAGFLNFIRSGHQRSTLYETTSNTPATTSRSYTLTSAAYMRSPYPTLPGFQYPVSYPGAMLNPRPFRGHPSPPRLPLYPHSTSPVPYSTQIEGPPGANLFIYHIPQEFGDQDLADAFQSFGRVLSAKVFIDKASGLSKCFGFVSYDSCASALSAIKMMNGYQLGGKKLKVQLKRDNRQRPHY